MCIQIPNQQSHLTSLEECEHPRASLDIQGDPPGLCSLFPVFPGTENTDSSPSSIGPRLRLDE